MIDVFTENKKMRSVVISFLFACLIGWSMYAGRSIDHNTGFIEVFLYMIVACVVAIALQLFIAFDAVVSVNKDDATRKKSA